VEEIEGGRIVEANLECIRGRHRSAWTDRLVLVRPGDSWKIADIVYDGLHKTTLLSSIKAGLSHVAEMIKKHQQYR